MELLFPRYVQKRHCYFLIVFVLNYVRLFNCSIYSYSIFKYGAYIFDIFFAFYFLLCAFKCNQSTKTLLEKSINAFYFILFIALLVGYAGGQYLDYAIKGASRAYLLWGIYYYLKLKKIPASYLLNILKFLLIGGMIVTLLCYIQYPNCWFGLSNEDAVQGMKDSLESRGVMRFNIPCKILSALFIFKELQFFEMKRKQILRLGILFLYLLMIGNRFPLIVCLLMVLYMIVISKHIKLANKIEIVLAICILLAITLIIPFTRNIIDKLLALSSEGGVNGIGEDNIRLLAATYFFTEFNNPNDYLHIILGNGMCFPNSGKYADKMEFLNLNLHYYQSDMGYCELFIYFGIIGLLVVALWFLGALLINSSPRYSYIKYFFIFLMIAMICGGYWFEYIVEVAMLSYVLIVSSNPMYGEFKLKSFEK